MDNTIIIELSDLRVGMLVLDSGKDHAVVRLELLPSGSICATLAPPEFDALSPKELEKSKVTVVGSKETPITVYS